MCHQSSKPSGWACLGVLSWALASLACDPFEVVDPQRYTDLALDSALEAVANGAEGAFHLEIDSYVIFTALLGDEWQHTGTWAGYDDLDKGRARYGLSVQSDPLYNALMRARYATQDAADRFKRVGLADTDPKAIQVKATEGWIDLYLAEGFCEATAGQGTEAVPDVQMYQQAITKLRQALGLAQQANLSEWINYTHAGLARAHLLAGSYDSAEAHARLVPDNFVKYAKFSATNASQYNAVVFLNTVGFNKAAGLRQMWWPMVDTIAGKMRDPWTGELDPRVEVRHPPGSLGVDGRTPHYSQWKYKALGDDIPITKGDEMRLIEAEVAWRKNQLGTAMAKLNALRAKVGLSPLPDPAGDANRVRDYLLSERFAVLYMEGRRLADLYRFNLIRSRLGPNRLMKFPMSQFEAQNNPNIEDDLSKRCQPIS